MTLTIVRQFVSELKQFRAVSMVKSIFQTVFPPENSQVHRIVQSGCRTGGLGNKKECGSHLLKDTNFCLNDFFYFTVMTSLA